MLPASMRKPLLAPSTSTANWFWSPTSPTSQRRRDRDATRTWRTSNGAGAQSDLEIAPVFTACPIIRAHADLLPHLVLYRVMHAPQAGSGNASRATLEIASPHPEAPRLSASVPT